MILAAILGTKYRLKIVNNTRDAFIALRQASYDLMLVDIDLPGESGFHFCARVKMDEKLSHLPLVFLTSHDQTPDVVIGFTLGADDYITKPIVRDPFEARIAAKLRKRVADKKDEHFVRKGRFNLDLLQQKVFMLTQNGQVEVQLTVVEFRLLKYFLDHTNHILSRAQLLNDVWGHNLSVTDRTVDTHVYTLRKKLGSFANCICTVSGVGYQFQPMEYVIAS